MVDDCGTKLITKQDIHCKACGHVTEEWRVRPVYNTCTCTECGCFICIRCNHVPCNCNPKPIEHNQCDICFKKFNTALGFHRHYPNCLRSKNERQ